MKNKYFISIVLLLITLRTFSQNVPPPPPPFIGYDNKIHPIVLNKIQLWLKSNLNNYRLIKEVSLTDDKTITLGYEFTLKGKVLKSNWDSTEAVKAADGAILEAEKIEPFFNNKEKQEARNKEIQKEYNSVSIVCLKFKKQYEEEEQDYDKKPVKGHLITTSIGRENILETYEYVYSKVYFYFDENYSNITVASLKKY